MTNPHPDKVYDSPRWRVVYMRLPAERPDRLPRIFLLSVGPRAAQKAYQAAEQRLEQIPEAARAAAIVAYARPGTVTQRLNQPAQALAAGGLTGPQPTAMRNPQQGLEQGR
jgi:hypothetical protein